MIDIKELRDGNLIAMQDSKFVGLVEVSLEQRAAIIDQNYLYFGIPINNLWLRNMGFEMYENDQDCWHIGEFVIFLKSEIRNIPHPICEFL